MFLTTLMSLIVLGQTSELATGVAPPRPPVFCAPNAPRGAAGTREEPVSLLDPLVVKSRFGPDREVRLLPGVYAGDFVVRNAGLTIHPDGPPWSAIIDGRLFVEHEPGQSAPNTVIEDLIIRYTGWTTRRTEQSGSGPKGFDFLTGLTIKAPGCRVSRCLIHDVAGVGLFSTGSVMEDCVIQRVGWDAPDRGHGHGLYLQGEDVTIRRCVFGTGFTDFGLHAYGSEKARLSRITIESCLVEGILLVGGGSPVQGLTIRDTTCDQLFLGYGRGPVGQSATLEGILVRDNVLIRGGWDLIRGLESVPDRKIRVLGTVKALAPAPASTNGSELAPAPVTAPIAAPTPASAPETP